MAESRTFTATLEPRPRGGVLVRVPFDPATPWRERDRWYVEGTIGHQPMRGTVELVDGRPVLALGPAWCRDPRVAAGTRHTVVLRPEGPQLETVPGELAERLRADEDARRAFESLATFYRKAFVKPIAEAARPETRVRRAGAVIAALRAHRREA
jgi:hypothetical protein